MRHAKPCKLQMYNIYYTLSPAMASCKAESFSHKTPPLFSKSLDTLLLNRLALCRLHSLPIFIQSIRCCSFTGHMLPYYYTDTRRTIRDSCAGRHGSFFQNHRYLSTQKATGNYQDDLPLFCAAADVNGDGTVNILDYQYLYKRIVMSEE